MKIIVRLLYYIFLSLILKTSANVVRNDLAEGNLRVRVRRQDGYVYDKPRIPFDLPSKATSTTQATQAPTVDRTLTQQMYYAYPAPTSGDTINVGNSAGTVTAAPGTTVTQGDAASGYNYKSSTTPNVGYSYGSPSSTGAQMNVATQVTDTASQTTEAGSSSASNTESSQSSNGYAYGAPSPTLSSSLRGSSELSTKAPRYLPPSTDGGSSSFSSPSTGNVSGVSVGSGTSSNTENQVSTSVQIPAANYLPPIDTINSISTSENTAVSIGSQTNSGVSVSVPSTAYLPPKSSSPSPLPGPESTAQPAAPARDYIPPSNTGLNSVVISTPATGYLPPVLS